MKPSLKVIVRGMKVTAELPDVLTSGMVGVPVEFQFNEDWGDLRKIGVFEGSGQKKYLDLNLGGELTIPWEVLTEERTLLKVGVEWRKPDGTVVIPTRWTEVGVVLPGAQAGNDPALEPSPTVYDQIMQAIESGRLKGADGLTPYIGGNGNWWLGKEDTGIKAEGKDGYTPVKGKDYFDGKDGYTPVKGVDYNDGAPGYTPVKGVDYWTEADQQAINAHIAEEVAALGDHSTIVCEAKGENILLTDSAKAKLRGLAMYGKSEQFTTTGVQLMPLTYGVAEHRGITYTFDGNRVSVVGTNDSGSQSNSSGGVGIYLPTQAGNYCFTQNPAEGIGLSVAITKQDGSISYLSKPYTLDGTEQRVFLYIRVDAGYTVNCSFDIMVNKGDSLLPFEPYTGGKPSPSPEYQQNPVIPGADGDIGVMFGGKNLFPIYADQANFFGITRDLQADGGYKFTGTSTLTGWLDRANIVATVPANGVYTFTADANVFTSRGLHFSHKRDGKELSVFAQVRKVVYTAEMLKGDTVAIMIGVAEGEVVNCTVYAQLELGSTATDFEKPKDIQTLTVLTPNGLPGIKVASGGNWTDSTGQQWVSDEVDFDRGVYVQRVYHATEKDATTMVWSGTGAVCIISVDVPTPNSSVRAALCSISSVYALGWENKSYAHHFVQKAGQKLVIVLPNTYTTVEQAQPILDAGFDFYYPLAEPIETPLSADELAKYRELHTNYPTTTATNNAGVSMKVSYVADAKNYIDKKINELRLAIVANV